MSIKGYKSQQALSQKLNGFTEDQSVDRQRYVTVQESKGRRHHLDVNSRGVTAINSTPQTIASGSSIRVIKKVAHGASKNDIIRLSDGTEFSAISIPDANTIITSVELDVDPTGDTFTVWRHVTPSYAADGSIVSTSGPVQYNRKVSGVTTAVQVLEDEDTPTNSRGLPVTIHSLDGAPINITAGDLNVNLTDRGSNPDATRIGDGTNLLAVNTGGSLSSKITNGTITADIKTLGTQLVTTDNGLVVNSAIHGITTGGGGGYVDVKVNPSGALTVEATVVSSTLPTGAATETTLAAMNSKLPSLGQALMAASQPVVIASNQSNVPVTVSQVGQQAAASSVSVTFSNENVQDLFITGQSAQTTTVNNIIPATSGASANDLTGYRSGIVQVVSTGTAGTFIFEGSNDNVNFIAINVYNQAILTGTPINAAITATASQIGYVFPIHFRYIRLRIASTITGGSIQAFSKFSQTSFSPAIMQIAQATAGNLNVTAGTSGAIIGYTATGVVASVDVGSSAGTIGTTNGTTRAVTNGLSVSFIVNITIATLTAYDFKVQESSDGVNWNDIWQSQRVAGVTTIITPALRIRATQYRFVEIAAGTSFTRTITSARMSHAGELIRNIVDRTIAPITTNSVTPTLYIEGCSYYTMTVAQGAGGSAVVFAIDGSVDGTNWIQNIKLLTGIVSGFVQGSVSGSYKFIRARVVTGVASATINYLQLEAKETPIDDAANQNALSSGTTALTTVVTVTPPISAIGFILQCDGIVANPLRWRAGGLAATVSSGYILQPGQDTGYIPGAPLLSLISTSGTSGYNLEWIMK